MIGNKIVNNPLDIANNLNKYFSEVGGSVVKDLENEINQLNENFIADEVLNNNSINVSLTNEQELVEIIKNIA